MTYGIYGRAFQRINVLRGYPGNETSAFTRDAKPKAAEAILSGMLINLDSNGQWVKYTANSTYGKIPYFALQDQSDTDVASSGLLTGLSCSGPFEIETPYFKQADAYIEGSPLIPDTDGTGQVKLGTLPTTGVPVVGNCTRGAGSANGLQASSTTNSEGLPLKGPTDGASANKVLAFMTCYRPVTA